MSTIWHLAMSGRYAHCDIYGVCTAFLPRNRECSPFAHRDTDGARFRASYKYRIPHRTYYRHYVWSGAAAVSKVLFSYLAIQPIQTLDILPRLKRVGFPAYLLSFSLLLFYFFHQSLPCLLHALVRLFESGYFLLAFARAAPQPAAVIRGGYLVGNHVQPIAVVIPFVKGIFRSLRID